MRYAAEGEEPKVRRNAAEGGAAVGARRAAHFVASRLALPMALLIALAVVLATASCSSSGAPATSSSSTAPTASSTTAMPLGVHMTVIDVGWSPAESMPAADHDQIAHGLTTWGCRMLFPASTPFEGFGVTTARYILVRSLPDERLDSFLSVYEASGELHIGVSARPGTTVRHGYEPVTVRGHAGGMQRVPAGWNMWWDEDGYAYLAEFGGDLAPEAVAAWLEDWYLLPREER
jgi:hypothetical protein